MPTVSRVPDRHILQGRSETVMSKSAKFKRTPTNIHMQTRNILTKFVEVVKEHQFDLFLGVCIVLVSFISFNIGKMNSLSKSAISTGQGADIYKALSWQNNASTNNITAASSKSPAIRDLRVVVSKKSSSMKYHFTWCPGAKSILDENKLWFNTEADAIQAGYTRAGNCQ